MNLFINGKPETLKAAVAIPVDGELFYIGFRVAGFRAPYTEISGVVPVEEFAEHDKALLESWKKASKQKREEIELEFKLGPVARAFSKSEKDVTSTMRKLSKEQFADLANPTSKAALAEDLESAQERIAALEAELADKKGGNK